jgi:hypothetical protein
MDVYTSSAAIIVATRSPEMAACSNRPIPNTVYDPACVGLSDVMECQHPNGMVATIQVGVLV